jgi:beta-glucanase (GH16 family)
MTVVPVPVSGSVVAASGDLVAVSGTLNVTVTPAVTPPPPPPPTTYPGQTPEPASGWTFFDEFTGSAGSAPDPRKWLYQTGGPGAFGNNELETYVNSIQNGYVDGNGNLVVAVTQPSPGVWHSARIVSNFHQLFGHWEAAIKLDNTLGCWPAFWFLGQGQWPGCGEIDLCESYGTGYVDSSIWSSTAQASRSGRSGNTDNSYHVYRLDWVKGSVQCFRDGVLFNSATSANLTPWPFDNNGGSGCIANIAVGGSGTRGATPPVSALPVKMLIDYVHVW